MGRNGVLPRVFARTHRIHETPHVAIFAQAVLDGVLPSSAPVRIQCPSPRRFPLLGVAALIGPLYYQCRPLPPYPIRYANWIAIGWLALEVVVTVWMARYRRQGLVNAARVFVDDGTAGR